MLSHEYRYVPRLRDAYGCVCEECGEVWTSLDWPWHFSKSKSLHESGTGHKVRYFALTGSSASGIIPRDVSSLALKEQANPKKTSLKERVQ